MSFSTYLGSPCAACKFLRRKCLPDCVFAPFFPPEEPQKFANVHKVFGASNVSKLLQDILPDQREDAVSSLAYEAEARIRDPVYGCVGTISVLQRQLIRLQKEVEATNADLLRYTCLESSATVVIPPSFDVPNVMTNLRYLEMNVLDEMYKWNSDNNGGEGHDSGGED